MIKIIPCICIYIYGILGVRLLLEETLLVVQERYRRASAELSSALSERGFTYVVKEVHTIHCTNSTRIIG